MATWSEISARVGRNEKPALLFGYCNILSRDDLAKAVADAWTMCEFPLRTFPATKWKALFRQTLGRGEFLDEETIADRSSRLPDTLTLYRGAPSKNRRGMSWTSDFDKALWFAERNHRFGFSAQIYATTANRTAVLARFHEGRKESEYVLDPGKLVGVDSIYEVVSHG